MAPKFQRPNLPNLENAPEAAALGQVGQTLQTLPMLYAQYRQQKMEQEFKNKQLQQQISQFDTTSGLAKQTLAETTRHNQALEAPKPSKINITKSEFLKRPEEYKLGDINLVDDTPKEKDGKASGEAFTQTNQLRQQYLNKSKDFVTVRDAHQRIKDSATNPSAAGDLALIFNYMKVLDPGSTVREGEFATAQNSAGVDDVIRAKYNQVRKGERLSEDTRNDFVNRAQGLYTGQEKLYKNDVKEFRRIAEKSGLDPDLVILDQLVASPTETTLPTPGAKFNGATVLSVKRIK